MVISIKFTTLASFLLRPILFVFFHLTLFLIQFALLLLRLYITILFQDICVEQGNFKLSFFFAQSVEGD